MPVEALVELVAYNELVVGVARAIYRSAHPSRQRMPRGFDTRLRLRLQTVERGSAVPILERVREPGTLMMPADEFTQARDLIEDAVAAIAADEPLPDSFPAEALVQFNRFGRTLRPDEAIELRGRNADHGPVYTREVRRRLILQRGQTVLDELETVGWVTEIDGARMTCLIRLQSGPSVPVQAPIDELAFEPLRRALSPGGQGPPVRISAVGVFDQEGGLVRLDAIHDVSPAEEPDDGIAAVQGRLDDISRLSYGWLDGDGEKVTTEALASARETLTGLLRRDVPKPRIYPTAEGGVQAEWSDGTTEISVVFGTDGTVSALAVTSDSDEVDELEDGDADRIARFVVRAR
jgi:hypothetical protein